MVVCAASPFRYDQVGTVQMDWHGCDDCGHYADGECLVRYTLKLERVEAQCIIDPEYIVVCETWTPLCP